jgi:peroxiredoxin
MFRGIVIGAVLFSLISTVVACTGPASTLKAALTPPPAPTAFQTADLAINPAEVNPAVELTITAQVTNTNATEGTYAAGLMINDVTVETMEVTMAAGESKPLSFVGAMATPGTYKVTWAERVGESLVPRLTGEFVVVGDEPIESSDSKTTAPDFTAVDVVTSETISLGQFSGSTVLLNFVNLGCSSSLSQIVSAQLLAIKELREQRDDFIPISVFCGCCSPDVLREFAEQNDLTWPWILDRDNSIVAKYTRYLREYGYPTLVFIDKDQNISEVTGYIDISTLSLKIDEISQ